MITKWKVFNFKSIREETELELGPLTIFAGANSSGKSTFIQSILLIAQTLSYKVNSRSVVLNGPLVGLGQFDDIKSNNSQADQISIGFTCKPLSNPETPLEMRLAPTVPRSYLTSSTNNRPILEVAAEVSFDADPSKPQEELLQIKPRLFGSELRCVARDEDNIDQMAKLVVRPSDKSIRQDDGVTYVGEIDDITRTGLSFDVKLDDKSSTEVRNEYVTAVPVGCGLHHFLPARIIYAINNVKETAHALAIALQTDPRKNFSFPRWFRPSVQLSVPILAVLKDVLSKQGVDLAKILNLEKDSSYQLTREFQPIRLINWYESMQKQDSKNRIAVQKALSDADDLYNQFYDALINSPIPAANSHGFLHSRPPRQLFEAANYLESFFSNSLKYLGPLRDAPKPVYPLAPSAEPRDVGLRGEHTAAVLELHKGTKIRYLPTSAFQKNFVEPAQITRTLEAAVIDWLQYLGVAESVQSKDLGKLGHELKVSLGEGEEPHDLTHVGVGVSQVLPILVMCLLAETDSTLVFEQPELHLHPKVQTLLGDFFLSMALCGKQCVVETHSEYLIDRLRFRLAAAPIGKELTSQTKIYFVEKKKGCSFFGDVEVNEFGAITNWPNGFFDQSQEQAEKILRAALAKQRILKSMKGSNNATTM